MIQILVQLVRILIHQLFEGLAVDEFLVNSPTAIIIYFYLQSSRDIDTADFFDTGTDKCFVQYFCFRKTLTENLNCHITITVDTFGRVLGY